MSTDQLRNTSQHVVLPTSIALVTIPVDHQLDHNPRSFGDKAPTPNIEMKGLAETLGYMWCLRGRQHNWQEACPPVSLSGQIIEYPSHRRRRGTDARDQYHRSLTLESRGVASRRRSPSNGPLDGWTGDRAQTLHMGSMGESAPHCFKSRVGLFAEGRCIGVKTGDQLTYTRRLGVQAGLSEESPEQFGKHDNTS